MKITASLLFYALTKSDLKLQITWGSDRIDLEELCVCDPSETERPQGPYLYIQDHRLFTPEIHGSVCIAQTDLPDRELGSIVLQIWNQLLSWENTLYRLLLTPSPVEKLFSQGQEYLHPHYTLVNQNFLPILVSPSMHLSPALTYAPNSHSLVFREELINALLLRKDFHEAANFKKPFYFENPPEGNCYCQNIFIHEQYYARFVMILDKDETRLSPGEEQLFAIFTSCLQKYFQKQIQLLYQSPSDILHQICHTLTSGDSVSPQFLENTLSQTGWKSSDLYVTTELQFFEESGWKSQLELTLPYLAHKLELEWPQSCTLIEKDKLLCFINLTRTNPDEENRFSDFCKKLALFVRENVCTAGVSSVFQDFTKLHDSTIQASAALAIGREEAPSYWYYLYDQYRLAHILQVVSRELSPGIYLHPALSQLRYYDREHGSQLADTLKAYLDCGQNMSAAAASLYIHRTSFCRRMDRIRDITDLDLNDVDTLLLLQLSFLLESRNFH